MSAVATRRTVGGNACKPCEFCGRTHESDGKQFNYQYQTDKGWSLVFCSKICYNAHRSMNN